jgi:hypothetical protein
VNPGTFRHDEWIGARSHARGDVMALSLNDIAANAEIQQKIFSICDIDIVVGSSEPAWITIDGAADFSVIARDGTGGLFIVTPSSPRIVYASSEGQAGVIAADLESLLALIVTCPHWQDLLKYSGKGESAQEMRRAAPFLESSWIGDDEEFAEARAFLTSELGISEPPDLVGALHRAVSTPIDIRFHGQPATPLFGRFTIDDNPFFRMRSE